MSKKYLYGASFNCICDDEEIGGGAEGESTLDYVGNDLDKMMAYLTKPDDDYPLVGLFRHEVIGRVCNLGGEVVAVLCSRDVYDDAIENGDPLNEVGLTCVIFKNPIAPIVIE